MPGFLAIALIVPVVAYLLFAEFVSQQTERRYRTDIHDDESTCFGGPVARDATEAGQAMWTGWREMVVTGIQDESPDCRSFKLHSRCGGDLPHFLGGQSIQVRIPAKSAIESEGGPETAFSFLQLVRRPR